MTEEIRIQKLIGLRVIIIVNLIALVLGLYDEIKAPEEGDHRLIMFILSFGTLLLIFGLYVRSNLARVVMLVLLWVSLVLALIGFLLVTISGDIGEYHWLGYVLGALGIAWDVWQIHYFNQRKVLKAFGVKVQERGYIGEKLCPYCSGRLRSPRARQCPHCLMSWHDTANPRKIDA